MKIAIAGSGALGCGFGYMMQKGGNDVTLLDFGTNISIPLKKMDCQLQ